MNTPLLNIREALDARDVLWIDARSEGEYEHGHIPGALSLPLLNNEDRHAIGIAYKQEGKQAAVMLGFKRVGPRFHDIIQEGLRLCGNRAVIVYCWRGGMRSHILAWLLQTAGLHVHVIEGGYKSFRTMALELFSQHQRMCILHGKTGSGKTAWLHQLKSVGEQVIDLEGLAHHKGSAFGGLGQLPQPSQEQFENNLAWEIRKLKSHARCWVEGESRMIGRIRIPDAFFHQMQNCPLVELDVCMESRMQRIIEEYAQFPKELLEEKTNALTKRMGGDRVKESIAGLRESDWARWLHPLLAYYDKTYLFALENAKGRKVGVICVEPSSTEKDIIRQFLELPLHEPT